MALTELTLSSAITFNLSKSVPGFNPIRSGNNTVNFNLNGVDLADIDQCVALSFTNISAAATETIDLTSLTNLVGESVTFTSVNGIMVKPVGTGSQLTFGPGASNGLVWVWGGSTQKLVIPPGSGVCYSTAANSTGATVDGTHKTLDFTNSGGSTMTSLTVIIWGSTS